MNTELQKFLKESRNAHKVISAKEEDSALFRWIKKPVKENLLLDSMEDLANFSFSGPGTVSVSNERPFFYERCIKVECPTTLEVTSDGNRSYSYTSLIFHANNADWRKYNRISFWVYPDCPGFQNVWISMTIHNDGQ